MGESFKVLSNIMSYMEVIYCFCLKRSLFAMTFACFEELIICADSAKFFMLI